MTRALALTARWTAAARARESARGDRLFDDPFAAALAGDDGFDLLARAEAASRPRGAPAGDNPFFAIRTRFFDDLLVDAVVVRGVRQVVLVAAGLDARAYRLAWPAATRVFELDRPEVLSDKQNTVERLRAAPRCDRRPVAVDLAGPWEQALSAAAFDARRPSVWIVEGLLAYLEEHAVRGLLARVAALAGPGARLGADLPGRTLLEAPAAAAYLDTLARLGAPWSFGTDEPEALFGAHGWRAVALRPGDPGASYGRWPRPLPPRGTPGAPSSFLVTADRDDAFVRRAAARG